MTPPGPPHEPAEFRAAVDAITSAVVRPEIEIGPLRPPQRLAPYSYAISAQVRHGAADEFADQSEGDAFGRLVLLYDPAGDEAWNGTMRLVAFVEADLEPAVAADPLLPEVGWSWLVDSLDAKACEAVALGGTVTATSSVRYGDIAGPPRSHQLEVRASWTATSTDLASHVEAFCDVLAYAAGLPPAGITTLGDQGR